MGDDRFRFLVLHQETTSGLHKEKKEYNALQNYRDFLQHQDCPGQYTGTREHKSIRSLVCLVFKLLDELSRQDNRQSALSGL